MPELTAKQAKFVAGYFVDGNGTRANCAAIWSYPGRACIRRARKGSSGPPWSVGTCALSASFVRLRARIQRGVSGPVRSRPPDKQQEAGTHDC